MSRPDALSASDESDTHISSLPLSVLEEIAGLCTPAAAASARLACCLLRCTFQPHGIRLYSQRPAAEAARASSLYPRACQASLLVANTRAVCSQEQLNAWLHALQQRTSITDLTLISAAPSITLFPPLPPPGLAGVASLSHLRSLVLSPHLKDQQCDDVAASVGHLQLTRLVMPAPTSVLDALAAAYEGGGLSQLRVLDLTMREQPQPSNGLDWAALVGPLLFAAAAATASPATPCLRVLALRNVRTPAPVMGSVHAAFGCTASAMDILCTGDAAGVEASLAGHGNAYVRGVTRVDGRRSTKPLILKLHSHSNSEGALTAAVQAVGETSGAVWSGGSDARPDVSAAASKAVAETLHDWEGEPSHAVGPHLTVSDLALFAHESESLDLSGLPPTLEALHFVPSSSLGLAVYGAAPALAQVTPDLPYHTLPLPALAAGCPNLVSLSLSCGVCQDSAWPALALLHRLTTLRVNGRSPAPYWCGSGGSLNSINSSSWLDAFCVAWLPPSLVTLQLHNMRVSGVLPLSQLHTCLSHLLSLTLHNCAVADLGAFSGARSLRTLEVICSNVMEGAEALFDFAELEDLLDYDLVSGAPPPGLLARAAAAAAAAPPGYGSGTPSKSDAGSSGDGTGGGGCGDRGAATARMPHLRSLTVRARDVVEALECQPRLLQTLCELHLVGEDSLLCLQGQAPALQNTLLHLCAFRISGLHGVQPLPVQQQLQALLPLPLKGEVVGDPVVSFGDSPFWQAEEEDEEYVDYDEQYGY